MKLQNSNKLSIVYCLLIAVIVAVISFSLLSPIQKASAEDTPYTPQLVNFNQLFNFTSTPYGTISVVSGQHLQIDTLSANAYVNLNCSVISGHIYYFYTNNSINRNIELTIDGDPTLIFTEQYGKYTANRNGTNNRLYFLSGFNGGDYYFNLIDLTQMGIEHYTLEQCKQLFTAPYYSYTTGTPYFLYNNAAAGQIAEFTKYNFAVNSGNLINMDAYGSYALTNTGNGYLELYTPIDYTDENRGGFLRYNFNVNIPAGSKITIKADNMTTMYNFSIWAGNGTDENVLFSIYSSQSNSPLEKTIMSPNSATYFYIWFYSNGSTSSPAITFNNLRFEIEFTTNMNDLLLEAYNNGVSDTRTYYSEGNAGYDSIYQAGYNVGLQNSDNVIGNAWEFISGTFSSFSSIFSLEVMPNITLGVFIAIPLLLGLLLFILRITRG